MYCSDITRATAKQPNNTVTIIIDFIIGECLFEYFSTQISKNSDFKCNPYCTNRSKPLITSNGIQFFYTMVFFTFIFKNIKIMF